MDAPTIFQELCPWVNGKIDGLTMCQKLSMGGWMDGRTHDISRIIPMGERIDRWIYGISRIIRRGMDRWMDGWLYPRYLKNYVYG